MPKVIAVILAGGKSVRMGRDKAELPAYGTTMLSHLADQYGTVFDEVYISGRQYSGARYLVDEYESAGPLAGLASAFTSTNADIVFITATDIPNGSPELAKRLVSMLCSFDACVIRLANNLLEPAFAVYSRTCLDAAIDVIEHGKRSFAEMLKLVNVRYVEETELEGYNLSHILQNVNTPEEYDKFCSEY